MADPTTAVRWEDRAEPDLAGWPASRVALLPVGATEQHGPHLPTGTDTIIAGRLCELAAERSGAVVLPPISIGASYGHGAHLAGTLSLRPEVLAEVVRSAVLWAHRTTGVAKVIIVNAHVGNAAALNVATDQLRLEHPEVRVAVRDWVRLAPVVTEELFSDAEDWHANRGETAVMMALAPELVHEDRRLLADDEDRTADLVFRYTAAELSRNGVTGRPSEATVELGRTLIDQTVEALVALIRRAEEEHPPLRRHNPASP